MLSDRIGCISRSVCRNCRVDRDLEAGAIGEGTRAALRLNRVSSLTVSLLVSWTCAYIRWPGKRGIGSDPIRIKYLSPPPDATSTKLELSWLTGARIAWWNHESESQIETNFFKVINPGKEVILTHSPEIIGPYLLKVLIWQVYYLMMRFRSSHKVIRTPTWAQDRHSQEKMTML